MRWKYLDSPDENTVHNLMSSIHVSRPIAVLLAQRGITDFESAREFFRPALNQLHDPFLMKGMPLAVERILKAIETNETILVYGDYDVDGTTAVALFSGYLKHLGANFKTYIPDRYTEGYGISFKGIDFAHENNIRLIVALDCGIKSLDKIDYAKSFGIDFIICDHHLPGNEVPNACAVLDPKQPDCNYPYKELSGCGIGFKLACAINQKLNHSPDELVPFLDLVAVSIAADIVPITGENRVLCYFGLQQLNQAPRPGLLALIEQNKFKDELTVNDIVFVIAPRINAAGRIEHGIKSVELLTSESIEEARAIAAQINQTNSQRKDLDQNITAHAIELIQDDEHALKKLTTVVCHKAWHKGVVGIVASRLVEKFYRPTIVLTESNGMLTGSARSVKDFDVYLAIENCAQYLEQFGGHKYAAGLTLHPDNFEAFKSAFENEVKNTITNEMLERVQEINLEINFSDITPKFIRVLKQFAPFGPGNMNPVFSTKNVFDTNWARVVGNNHLKLELYQHDNPDNKIQAIGFDKGDYLPWFKKQKPIEISYTIGENEWNGFRSIQLQLKDIRIN